MLMTQSATPAPFSRQRAPQLLNSSNNQGQVPGIFPHYPQEGTGLRLSARDPNSLHLTSSNNSSSGEPNVNHDTQQTLMNSFSNNAPQPVMWVRALYDYE